MPVPSTLASLSTTPGSNSPSGGENPFPELDDHIRQGYAFTAQLRDQKLNSSAVSAYMLTVLDDANAGAARTTLGAVGNSGNETIAGVKTFSSAPKSSAAASATDDLMRKGEVDSAVAMATPPGAVMPFAQSTAPSGWLKCDGSLVSRTTYAALFAAIGTTFGAGDGSTTFALPDLRGEFVRGWDDGRGVDSGRVFGTAQVESVNLSGTIHTIIPNGNNPTGAFSFDQASGANISGGASSFSHVRAILTGGGTETRPRNVALLYCIKT